MKFDRNLAGICQMPLSTMDHPYLPTDCLEALSTAVFLGSVVSGFAAIAALLLYNLAWVLFQEAARQPVIAALYILAAGIGVLFVVDLDVKPAATPFRPNREEDPIHVEEDPQPLLFEGSG